MYELFCILPGTLTEEESNAKIQSILDIMKENGAEDIKTKEGGKSRLAYPMKHIRYGYFYTILFSSETTQVATIKEKLRLVTDILRTMLHVYNEEEHNKKEAKIQQMKQRSEKFSQKKAEKEDTVKPEKKNVVKEEVKQEKTEKAPETKKEVSTPEEDVAPQEEKDIEDINKKLDEILEKDIADI
tara:strand:+ start:519 stop:1073 length:555 start_codon:yes stop_codon:yes gene_type:complete